MRHQAAWSVATASLMTPASDHGWRGCRWQHVWHRRCSGHLDADLGGRAEVHHGLHSAACPDNDLLPYSASGL